MAWDDRLREAAYTSPGGTRQLFQYENVQLTVSKKTTAFEYPDVDGTFVQDLGVTGRRYPLRLFFSGSDYDFEAEEFLQLLSEVGTGTLEHPSYGTVDVVPFGDITRRDDLVTQANQAIFEVTFFSTIGVVFPTSQADPSSDVNQSVEEYNDAAADEYADSTDITDETNRAEFENQNQALVNSTVSTLSPIAASQDDTERQFSTISDSILRSLPVLSDTPAVLGAQTILMIQSPARAQTSISARLDAYESMTGDITIGDDTVADCKICDEDSNEFHINDLYASTYITGSIISVLNHQFVTKSEALLAAQRIIIQFESVSNWREANFAELGEIDTGAAYQQLQQSVAITAGFLVQLSFSLKQERRFTLERERTIIDLVAELYGSVDDQLDFFIYSNNLTGSEILLLPRGRQIVYYA
jgi:hypothetical protein